VLRTGDDIRKREGGIESRLASKNVLPLDSEDLLEKYWHSRPCQMMYLTQTHWENTANYNDKTKEIDDSGPWHFQCYLSIATFSHPGGWRGMVARGKCGDWQTPLSQKLRI
jgi:hypothetical protein